MVFILVLAIALLVLGLFTVKILWLAALVLGIVWLVGAIRSGGRSLR